MLENAHTTHIRTCERCGIRYDWRKSPSTSLKMTYCGSLCEMGALGFTIEAMLHGTVAPPAERTPIPAAWLIAA